MKTRVFITSIIGIGIILLSIFSCGSTHQSQEYITETPIVLPTPPRIGEKYDVRIDVYVDDMVKTCIQTQIDTGFRIHQDFGYGYRDSNANGKLFCFGGKRMQGNAALADAVVTQVFILDTWLEGFKIEFGGLLSLQFYVHENGKVSGSTTKSDGASYQKP